MFQKNDSSLYKGAFDGQPQGLSLRAVRNYRFTFLRLVKDCKGSNSINNLQKTKGTANAIPFIFWRRARGFFGVLPYAFASLRSLTTDFQTVHRTVFIGKADRPCSNPLLKITQRKTRHSKRYTLFSWRRARDSAHFVRRKVCYANYPDYRLLLTRLRLAKDCKGSNPINNSQKITVQCYSHYTVISGGEQGIRTLETVLAVYTISNRAPSTSSDNSPCHL